MLPDQDGNAEVDHLLHGHLSGKGPVVVAELAVVGAGLPVGLCAPELRVRDRHAAGLTKMSFHRKSLLDLRWLHCTGKTLTICVKVFDFFRGLQGRCPERSPDTRRGEDPHLRPEGEQIAAEPAAGGDGGPHQETAPGLPGDGAGGELVVDPEGHPGRKPEGEGDAGTGRALPVLHRRRGRQLPRKAVLGDLQGQDTAQPKGAVGVPVQAPALEVPGPALEDQPDGEDPPPGLLPGGGQEGEGGLPALEDGSLQGVEPPVRPWRDAPGGEVHLEPVRLPASKEPRQFGQGGLGGAFIAGEVPQGGEEGGLLLPGEGGPV